MIKLKSTIGLAFIALLTLLFISCEKDKDDPDYVGTWINEEVDDSYTMTTTLVLTVSTFNMSMTMSYGDIEMEVAGMEGNLSVSGEQFTLTVTRVGMINFNTSQMVWYSKGEEGWDETLAEMDMDESMTATYKVEGNQLIITVEGEDQVFTRQ
jgi:hypothetical protein